MGIRVDPGKAKKVLSLITIFSSLFFAGFINTFGSEFGHSFSPFIILACIVQRGFPFGCFFFLLLVFGGLSTAFYQMYLKTPEQKDPMGRNFVLSDSNSYGQAHFEQPEEYKHEATIESPETALGMIYGQYDDKGKMLITQRLDDKRRGNGNVAVIGASGSGKTYTFVGPALLQIARRRESVFITDPDGGLHKEYSPHFRRRGYKVGRISLNDMHKSDGWDCLKSVKNVEDATMFAEVVISNVLNESDQNSIYGSGSKILLQALILRVILDPRIKTEEKTIYKVYRSLLDYPDDTQMTEYIYDLEQFGDVAIPCLDAYKTFELNGEKMRTNIRGNLAVYLQVFSNPLVRKLLSTDDIDLELPGRQPCAYFCGFPDSHSTYKFITALFFSMSFIRLYNYADVIKHGKLDIPVNFMLDEFPSIGGLPDWDKKMATLRKRNINVTMIFQDIAQFQNIYEKSWGTILNNCKTMVLLGINEDKSAALMSKRIGDTTIKVKTEQKAKVESVSSWWSGGRESVGEGKRALVSYSDLFTMHEDNAIILFQGHNPVYCRKYPITLHPDAKYLTDVDYKTIPDIDDAEGRAKVRAEEQEYIEQYLKEHPLSEVDRTYKSLYEKKKTRKQESALLAEIRKRAEKLANNLERGIDEDSDESDLIQLDISEQFTILPDGQKDVNGVDDTRDEDEFIFDDNEGDWEDGDTESQREKDEETEQEKIVSTEKNDDGIKNDSSQLNQEDIEEKECEITQNEVQVEANKTTEKATESEQEETVKEQKKPQGNPHTKHKREERAQSIKKQASGKVEFYGLQRPKREGEESAPVNRPQKRKN